MPGGCGIADADRLVAASLARAAPRRRGVLLVAWRDPAGGRGIEPFFRTSND
jgi:hypothetical protein